jgi:putative phosphoesterase
MKAGFIADLHIDRNFEVDEHTYLTTLLRVIQEKKLDLLVIGGDISNHYTKTIRFVEELQKQAKVPVYFIPGNHDFWEEKNKKKNTRRIYRIYKEHPQSLIEKPLKLTSAYSLVGHPAWYNYAVYNTDKFSKEEVEKGKFRWTHWQDKVRLDWEMSDRDVSRYFSNIIRDDLEKVSTPHIILQTHIVTIPEFTIPMPDRLFDFFNAYLATDDLADILKDYPISHQIMGHVHFRGKIKKENTQFITNSLGYRKEWPTKNLYREIQKSIVVLEL